MDINPRDIQMKISASRPLLELGERWELYLEIENDTEAPIWITGMTTTLALPVEVAHPDEKNFIGRWSSLPTIPGEGKNTICIPPKGKYLCQWRLQNEGKEETKNFHTLLQFLKWHIFFHPAKYEFFATVHIWTEKPDMIALEAPVVERRTREEASKQTGQGAQATLRDMDALVTAQAAVMDKSLCQTVSGKIEIATQSFVILVAAALGGVLAFVFKMLSIAHTVDAVFSWRAFLSLPSYVLSACIISLVLSRITEAKFPLTIKIMDFWGGMALGLIAAIGGNYFLNSIFEMTACK